MLDSAADCASLTNPRVRGNMICCFPAAGNAQVAELADALASGASSRKGVEVRVLSWAPFKIKRVMRLRPSVAHCDLLRLVRSISAPYPGLIARLASIVRQWGFLSGSGGPWLSAFSDERKTWSRLPYRPRGIRCLPTGCRRRANMRKGFQQTSPKRLCREPWSEGNLPQHR